MISKKISDLNDINFEISTALQFEPSPLGNRKGHDGHLAKQVLKKYYS